MRRFLFGTLTFILLIVSLGGSAILSQSDPIEPAPTLVPPTLVPYPSVSEEEMFPSESTVARIQRNGVVKVGILYNAPPFGELNIRGEHAGYDADLARSIAETWGVEIEFVQVTRQPTVLAQLLRDGQVDMLIAALVHHREFDSLLEFSQTYYLGRQSVLVRAEDPATEPMSMANRTLGVVTASAAQEAVNDWITRNGLATPVRAFFTLDQAYSALINGQIDGVVDSNYRLRQIAILRPELTRTLETPIALEPYAIAVLRQDVSMRNLVNRTLQYLAANGRLGEIQRAHFPGEGYATVIPWDNLGGDAPSPSQYPTNLIFPTIYVVPQLQSNRVVRVAGLIDAGPDAPESERRLDTFHRALLEQMAARWGVAVEFIPNSAGNALELVASGQADIAVGATPDWNWANRVDFTGGYLLHGERLMVRTDYEGETFAGLSGGGMVVTPINEPTAAARAVQLAESIHIRIEISQQREQDLAFALLADENLDAEAAFGDSLRLIPHVQQNPADLRLTRRDDDSRWYSQKLMVLAVPLNDIDFRLLVEYTLQELARDGTLYTLLQPLMMPDEIPTFEIWPGTSVYLSFSLEAH